MNVDECAAEDRVEVEQRADDRQLWSDPELVELDYEQTENAVTPIFDGVSYS